MRTVTAPIVDATHPEHNDDAIAGSQLELNPEITELETRPCR